MRLRSTALVGCLLTLFSATAQASPLLFDVDGPGSSISYAPVAGGCGLFMNPCASVATVTGSGTRVFNLSLVGNSRTFDFATFTSTSVSGLEAGTLSATVRAARPNAARTALPAVGAEAVPAPGAFGLMIVGLLSVFGLRLRRRW